MKRLFPSDTARSCIRKWVALGHVDGVNSEMDGRKLRFYPSKENVNG
jgi:hypothetical protein